MFGALNPELANAVSKVTNSTKGLLSMIESILVTTTIETGTIALTKNEFDLTEFLEQLKSLYNLPLDTGRQLLWDIPPGPIIVETDAEKLKRILQNLIDNSIKFTEKGFITVSARLDAEKTWPSA
jgi:signal transduction histidine kinase